MKKLPFLLLGCMALGATGATAQNLIGNSGFETPNVASVYANDNGSGSYAYGNGWAGTPGGAYASGTPLAGTPWTFTDQAGIAVAGAGNGFGVPTDQGFGSQVGFIQYNAAPPGGGHPVGAGSLSQSFTPGSTEAYFLSFSFLQRPSDSLGLSFIVTVLGGATNFSQTFTASSTLATPSLYLGNLSAGTNYTLTFTALTTSLGVGVTDSTAFIDNVVVAVPEPGTWLAGGLAVAGCGVVLMRRRPQPVAVA